MFDRDLGQWYRELFFPPQAGEAVSRHAKEEVQLWGVLATDVPERPTAPWFASRRSRIRQGGHRADLT